MPHSAVILDERDDTDRATLTDLRADPGIELLDHRAEQLEALRGLRPAPGPELLGEPTRWACFPWRRTAVGILGPRAFAVLRLDRNRNLITAAEQDRLRGVRVGVAGLSVGHVIAHTLATEGLCGELVLADFDTLELSNLNRVPAGLLDLGENKAVVAARRIAEIDPYLPVRVLPDGVRPDNLDAFLDGLDVVVEECDSLDMKAIVREAARRRRLPVVMATSDRGLIDVERFDREPDRPILHGLLGEVDAALLAGMSAREKIPHMLGHLDVPQASARAAASMVEVGVTLTTWPQLAGEVGLGATAVAEAVRRIGLGEDLESGRARIDVAGALDRLTDPVRAQPPAPVAPPPEPGAQGQAQTGARDTVHTIAAAALRAPSGGNAQPWRITAGSDSVTVTVDPRYSSSMDVGHRGAALSVGAAMFNARVAAAAHGVLGPVEYTEGGGAPLSATLHLADGRDPALAARYAAMLHRETNRHLGQPGRELSAATASALRAAAEAEHARLRLLSSAQEIQAAAAIVAGADRIRYLSPGLHAEMIAELRFPGDPDPDTGLDVRSLELDAGDLAALEILRRADVMAHLARWGGGAALGEDSRGRITASSALAAVIVAGDTLADYARGGAALESVWIAAGEHGLAVQPISPMFVHARTREELRGMSPRYADELYRLHADFDRLLGVADGESIVLLVRLAFAAAPSVRSRRSADRIGAA
ncbi:Rv1355c family protein [Mycolicibacterium palauense]|uniref:Rv1355c family protein n=1 Tax=Mycolicibacterium palauense TaxID=2034511 RepID=UPI000BFEF355|nr:Rv1355c family protein [Mycolicibacterium palauense]